MSDSQMIFINLPVRNLNQSVMFYQAIGLIQNQQFSDETAACMVVSDSIFVMLLTHTKWKKFTNKEIPNPHKSAQVLLSLSRSSQQEVDIAIERGQQAGGQPDPNPPQNDGWMFSRSLADPDGHIWEWVWMDPSAMLT